MEYLKSDQNKLVENIRSGNWQAVKNICNTDKHLINTYDEKHETPLMTAVWKNASNDVLSLMVDNATTENLAYENWGGKTILHVLSWKGREQELRQTLEKNSEDVNKITTSKRTPLHYCLHGWHSFDVHNKITSCLIDYGASTSVLIKDKDGKTPLDLYTKNQCRKYIEATKAQDKQELRTKLKDTCENHLFHQLLLAIKEAEKPVLTTTEGWISPGNTNTRNV
ncbi:uncharacterized protein LOC117121031 [Anneissia japonica]|uniref:uncharacterized protein LOC117121031 n=1 Tax=Anneissia japonica TaxID=1529436 RepID=UPI0014256B63|nr:uncharacterized protein LOC117121031 [Anneissia japonica]